VAVVVVVVVVTLMVKKFVVAFALELSSCLSGGRCWVDKRLADWYVASVDSSRKPFHQYYIAGYLETDLFLLLNHSPTEHREEILQK